MKKKNLNAKLALKKDTISTLSNLELLKGGGGTMNSSFAGNCPFGCAPDTEMFCPSNDKYCQTLDTVFKDCKDVGGMW